MNLHASGNIAGIAFEQHQRKAGAQSQNLGEVLKLSVWESSLRPFAIVASFHPNGASWGEAGEGMHDLLKPDVGGRKIKDLVGRFLGYGLADLSAFRAARSTGRPSWD